MRSRSSLFMALLLFSSSFLSACEPGLPFARTFTLSPRGTSTPTSTPTRTPRPTATSSQTATLTPTLLPYSSLPHLANLVVTWDDFCLADYQLPVVMEFRNLTETDLTSSADTRFCTIDCVRKRWSAGNGASLTMTIARLSSQTAATTLLEEELERVQQLYSDPDQYLGFGLFDPYTGIGDVGWAGKPYPGSIGYHAITRASVFIMIEWSQNPQSYDMEFDFSMTEAFARLQFNKIDGALGAPYPPPNQQSICSP
jgi:hypothetical protein